MDAKEAVPVNAVTGRLPLSPRNRRLGYVALAICGISASAMAVGIGSQLNKPATLMAPSDYLAAKTSIETDSRKALDLCLVKEGAALGLCRAEVQGDERTRRAALEARYLGTVEAQESAVFAKADALYEVTAAKCDAREGKARLKCLKLARAQRDAALAPIQTASAD